MRNYFSIPKDKFPQLVKFIRSNAPSFRHLNNPSAIGDNLWINATMTVEDGNKLSIWCNENLTAPATPTKISFFQKALALFE